MREKASKFYQLVHPGGPGGLLTTKPKLRKQDKRAKSKEGYAVVFFPKITQLGAAAIWHREVAETFSQSAEAAQAKFMDGIKQGETWETYHDAGHRVRRVRVIDLGDA